MRDYEVQYDREVDRINRMLAEGRITEEQFVRLSRQLDKNFIRETLKVDTDE